MAQFLLGQVDRLALAEENKFDLGTFWRRGEKKTSNELEGRVAVICKEHDRVVLKYNYVQMQ